MNAILLTLIYKEWRILLVKLDACNNILSLKLLSAYTKHQHELALQTAQDEAVSRGIMFINKKTNIS